MYKFSDQKTFNYAPEIVNKVILEVDKYPEFLPWCKNATIISRKENEFIAELVVSFKGFTESYKSQVQFWQEEGVYHIETHAISGPFRKLYNKWEIVSEKEGCTVKFFIDFEFKSKILDIIIGMVFSIATEKMINAFEERAKFYAQTIE